MTADMNLVARLRAADIAVFEVRHNDRYTLIERQLVREAADRIEALEARSVPAGLETTAEDRARYAGRAQIAAEAWADKSGSIIERMHRSTFRVDGEFLHRLLRDHDTLTAAFADKEAEIATANEINSFLSEDLAAEKEKREAAEAEAHRLREALRPFDVVGEETPEQASRPDYWDAIASCGRVGLWSLGDLRHARAVLSNKTGETK